MTIDVKAADMLKGMNPADLLVLTKSLYAQVAAKIDRGEGTQVDFAACNAARKEIADCEKFGFKRNLT